MEMQKALAVIDEHIKDGRFQRSLSLVAAGSSLISGLEVGYEHYKGSYGNRAMYSPVALSAALTATAVAGVFSTNIIMGPPIFAPLLFGTAAYLGFIASYLQPEGNESKGENAPEGWRRELSEGQFQKHMAAVAALWTLFSGAEAWYSHYKSRFRIWSQWVPVLLSPIQFAACLGAVYNERVAQKFLPASSCLSMAAGGLGFFYHVRGVVRRPGKTKHWLYNVLYGPPVFAPLLFAACGALGVLASLLRREK